MDKFVLVTTGDGLKDSYRAWGPFDNREQVTRFQSRVGEIDANTAGGDFMVIPLHDGKHKGEPSAPQLRARTTTEREDENPDGPANNLDRGRLQVHDTRQEQEARLRNAPKPSEGVQTGRSQQQPQTRHR